MKLRRFGLSFVKHAAGFWFYGNVYHARYAHTNVYINTVTPQCCTQDMVSKMLMSPCRRLFDHTTSAEYDAANPGLSLLYTSITELAVAYVLTT